MKTPDTQEAGERTQHTPGPWLTFGQEITANNPRRPGYTVSVAIMQGSYIDDGQTEAAIPDEEIAANARLIATAPDQNKALRDIILLVNQGKLSSTSEDFNEEVVEKIGTARAAIAKADCV